ncbi:ankyrin repeat domain-containing protein [Xanthomonas hortorum pv. vitians]|uniref:ankyrin repeat domain-containing protein n=1 Tax=Xanthomonas hortorum TaxID=56454 RepID=UPI0012A8E274|nr:ankyrin repeat domain-containing protein [Xanthomonas hortorum]MCE4282752.1 ankyrin repeat domain-containing protein [Xanthomonas hortorum pv. vitians]MCE4286856.1 ankyrin repeat domain-containing protein [Xanthomonas hortorum pv. vitians]MCE4287970.1 ankyrin repeat domain-containing protein [Xanthomonas hortorum pv. vitians]MCE4295659.1 ankyrin repeat domain-containing protein [Xanthomonas hortorum pv. vitians]MDT7854272.1 ankyrin repeat domain-containing protein [Xanthomonas hortorum pv. 
MKQAIRKSIRQAVKQGSEAYVQSLCEAQGDSDAAARYAIDVAISGGKESLVDQLVPLLSKSFAVYPLDVAVKAGSVRAVEQLMEFCDAENDEALVLAARHGHTECVKRLLKECSPLQHDSLALYEAARHGHADVVFQLVVFSDAKAQGSRALIAACREGHLEAVKHLLPFSSKIQCALHGLAAAAENNHAEVVEFLIEAGLPDPEDTYALGLNVAAAKGHATLVGSLLWAIVRTGHAPRDFGEKALFAAATKGDAGMVKSILEFAHKTAYPELGLHTALRNGHDEVVDILVRRVNLDHVRDLIADEAIEAKLDEAIARVDAAKQHRELQSNERKRVAQSDAAEPVTMNSSRSVRL